MTGPGPGPRDEPPVGPDHEAMRDFDDVERITRAFRAWARMALIVGLPVWLLLLLSVPRTGLGPMPSLALSTLLATALVVVAERLRRRRAPDGGPEGTAPGTGARRPMSAVTAVLLTLGVVIGVAYTLFVIIIVIRG